MALRALIVDDEPLARERIAQLLEHEPDVDIVGECGDGKAALRAIKGKKPDLIFLDIQLPEMDGFEIIDSLGADRPPAVIFVTAYDRFAVKAFRIHAIDYLLKPVDGEQLTEALHNLRQRIRLQDGELRTRFAELFADLHSHYGRTSRIVLKSDGELVCLKPAEIDWVESARNHVGFHVAGHTYIVRETMNDAEGRLCNYNFVRIHRGTIVNLDRIKRLKPRLYGDYLVELRDGTKLPMSRGYLQTVLERVEGKLS